MLEVIATKVAEEAAKSAVGMLHEALKRENSHLLKKEQHVVANFASATHLTKDSLAKHIEEIRKWCASINFSELEQKKSTLQIYVEVDTYLVPLSRHAAASEKTRTHPLLKVLTEEIGHTALLGTAGAGKTTALKKVCADYFTKGKVLLNYNFPILVSLRDIYSSTTSTPVIDKIQEILAIQVGFPKSETPIPTGIKIAITQRVVAAYIDGLKAAVLLDGFDEISNGTVKGAVLQEFDSLSRLLSSSRLILTSRSSDFRYSGESVRKFEIAPLTLKQVETFANRWLGSYDEAKNFLSKVAASPFADTAIRPLTMAHLCAIYERTKDIPDKPKSVYRRIVNLLLKEWDEDRRVKRESQYSTFDVDRKLEFLAQLAFELTTREGAVRFSSETLRKLYARIRADHGLPEKEATNVIQEIESHNGLVIQSGYDHFEFAHKSIQEFLAADYIVRLPSLVAISPVLHLLPNEMAIATALSSKPGEYLCELMLRAVASVKLKTTWYSTYANRLIQEKPDLTIGHTVFTTVAALHLATNTEDSERLGPLLKGMTAKSSIKVLSRYYKVAERSDGFIKFARLASDPDQKLPRELIAPENMLS